MSPKFTSPERGPVRSVRSLLVRSGDALCSLVASDRSSSKARSPVRSVLAVRCSNMMMGFQVGHDNQASRVQWTIESALAECGVLSR